MRSNCLIIAGEKSGEEHAMSFLPKLMQLKPECEFWGVGGSLLEKQGVKLSYHLRDFSSWGISEVIKKLPFYFQALKTVMEEVESRNCKVAILIDFQDFNLALAKRLHKKGISILYYVAPQAWAWRAKRASAMQRLVHTLFCILPFEKKWFSERGVTSVIGVTHPLMVTYKERLKGAQDSLGIEYKSYDKFDKNINLLLLPGSRNSEVASLLPVFMEAVGNLKRQKKQITLSIVTSSNVDEALYKPFLGRMDKVYKNVDLSSALVGADLSVAASGTVTLATSIFEVPTVVCFKTSKMNEIIFKLFIRYKGAISLTNIILNKRILPELTQGGCNASSIEYELLKWIGRREEYEKVKRGLVDIKNLLQGEGVEIAPYMAKVIEEAYEDI